MDAFGVPSGACGMALDAFGASLGNLLDAFRNESVCLPGVLDAEWECLWHAFGQLLVCFYLLFARFCI